MPGQISPFLKKKKKKNLFGAGSCVALIDTDFEQSRGWRCQGPVEGLPPSDMIVIHFVASVQFMGPLAKTNLMERQFES